MSLEEKESEFGRGLTYCLGLFLAHASRMQIDVEAFTKIYPENPTEGEKRAAEIWFNGSSDHMYEFDTGRVKDVNLKKRLETFQKKVLHWGHGFEKPYPTIKDVEWAVSEAKDLLLQIDKTELGVKAIEADHK